MRCRMCRYMWGIERYLCDLCSFLGLCGHVGDLMKCTESIDVGD